MSIATIIAGKVSVSFKKIKPQIKRKNLPKLHGDPEYHQIGYSTSN